MNTTNFMSASRLASRNQRRRVRAWICICAIYSFVLVTGSALAQFVFDVPVIRQVDVAKVTDEISRAKTTSASLQIAARRENVTMQTIHVLSQQPDWSLLLNAMADCRGKDIFFTNCELRQTHAVASDSPAASASAGSFTLRLGGVGQSEEAISSFIVRLGALPILGHVSLEQTNRLDAFGGDAFAFQLECTIRSSAGGSDGR